MREQPKVTKLAVVDIESLAKGPDAKIASIGCVIVDVENAATTSRFFTQVDITSQKERKYDIDTMFWWLKQASENIGAVSATFHGKDKLHLGDALIEFSQWLERQFQGEPINMFGNGPEFDNVILSHAYEQSGLKTPWAYFGNQSIRTALLFYRIANQNALPNVEFEGVKHHALDDAYHEARVLIEALKVIKG